MVVSFLIIKCCVHYVYYRWTAILVLAREFRLYIYGLWYSDRSIIIIPSKYQSPYTAWILGLDLNMSIEPGNTYIVLVFTLTFLLQRVDQDMVANLVQVLLWFPHWLYADTMPTLQQMTQQILNLATEVLFKKSNKNIANSAEAQLKLTFVRRIQMTSLHRHLEMYFFCCMNMSRVYCCWGVYWHNMTYLDSFDRI